MATLLTLRRIHVFSALVAALALSASASAALRPIDRSFGERTVPRVRPGTIAVPARTSDRIRVIVGLAQPPLAAEHGPGFFGSLAATRLDVKSKSSRSYLAELEAAQAAAVRSIRTAIPAARFSHRFQVVLNGITVDVPVGQLARLNELPFVSELFPSRRYTLATNRSPALMGAPGFIAATGAGGAGVKVGVIDDGVDQQNPFFSPAGFSYPAGFPKGQTAYTTPKVIVARGYPGPGAGARGRLPFDPQVSFHGTHVAGIAAGNANTTSPGGRDHPPTTGLSGVAPQAWIGNYRVFNVPSPIGHIADSPEIAAAFEQAVRDGMDVINFSGGGAATEPRTDVLVQAVANTANAGVIPVISAGNDRDEFGLGSAGSPGTTPEAVTVAATSNAHVYAPVLTVRDAGAPPNVTEIPFEAPGAVVPAAWGTSDRTLVDVGAIRGTNGALVDAHLCGLGRDPNAGRNPLPRGSLAGGIALIQRGRCTFVSKTIRALEAGATGLVFIDNRQGEASGLPLQLPVPSGMVSNLDGANLRSWLGLRGGRSAVRIGPGLREVLTNRPNVITHFSSAGPAAFGHHLKPDISAPGGEILSASTQSFAAGARFVSIDGTSMAAPHAAGAAAILRQRHRDWSVQHVKSALMSTAGPAWGNTARTQEASVLLGGAGFVNIPAADDPRLFTEPSSLSFGDVRLGTTTVSKQILLTLRDAGGGSGVWTVELQPQSATAGVSIDVPSLVTIGPGSMAALPVTVVAAADATPGDQLGFLVLRQGAVARRVPYAAFVTRPGLAAARATSIRRSESGTTRRGRSMAGIYRWPAAPFGQPPDYGVGAPMREDGAERVFSVRLRKRVLNFGVSVVNYSSGAQIDPFLLGAKDENSVQGYVGTPTNINGLTIGYTLPIGAAGIQFALPGTYYVSVDSGRDDFTGRRLAGTWRLRSWTNDLRRPTIELVTTRVTAGRPTLALRVRDRGAGVDPISLVISYNGVLVGAQLYNPDTGLAVFPLPETAPRIGVGRPRITVSAADFQEAKNANTYGDDVLPNTRTVTKRLRSVRGMTLTWLAPFTRSCVERNEGLLVAVGGTRIQSVRFFDGKRRIGLDRTGVAGLYSMTWRTRRAKRGVHRLRAVVQARGRRAVSTRVVRVCK